MKLFWILIGTGFLFFVLVLILANSSIDIIGPEDLELIGLNVSEVVLGEGDLCTSYGNSPQCKSGLICDKNPTFPDADGRCIRPNVTSVYNIRS